MIAGAQDDSGAPRLLRPWAEIELLGITLTIVVAWLAIVLFAALVDRLSKRLPTRWRFYAQPWPPIVRLVVITAAVVMIVPLVFVPKQEAMFAVIGSGAVAIGFAFKDYVSSLIAGVVMLFERPCSVGDWIRIGGVYGRVQALRLRVIEVVTPDDDRVSVPNEKIWTEPVHNSNSGLPDHMCVADFHVDPEHDAAAVQLALEDVALTSAFRNLDRPVVVVAHELRFSTHYRLKAYPFDGNDQFAFITDMTVRGRATLQRLGARPARAPALVPADGGGD